ncbi:MAG: M23 family metallopeptidase, partial [Gemmatimonadetes bacterium]|nr:M23 family metallopeptidase [Gemmatimonadota bacterium]
MPRDERRMTFIVIPHGEGDLSTRSFEISYRRLRVALFVGMGVALLLLLMAVSWFWMAAQAARIPGLNREIAELQKDRARVQELAQVVARMERQYEQVRMMLGGDALDEARRARAAQEAGDTAGATLPTSWPLGEKGFVTREQLTRVKGEHPGMDIAVPEGSQVLAAGGGVVAEVGEDSVYGRFVRVRHRDGYESMYGHTSRVLVERGAHVAPKQAIALSGNTGLSTAP